ncbi:hypothetical protein ACHAXT_009784 [Thalassiosira profunda]
MRAAAIFWLFGGVALANTSSITSAFTIPQSRQCSASHRNTNTELRALPPFNWFFQKSDGDAAKGDANDFAGKSAKEAETMQRTAKMMEDHRRSQEAAERTAAIVDELSSATVVGKSKGGAGGGIALGGDGRKGGVKVTFDGHQRPVAAEVDPNFLFSASASEFQGGVLSIDELNEAIAEAMEDGYKQGGKLAEEKIKGLYEQLGLPREPPSLPDDEEQKR